MMGTPPVMMEVMMRTMKLKSDDHKRTFLALDAKGGVFTRIKAKGGVI